MDFAWLGLGFFRRCGSRILRGFEGGRRAGARLCLSWGLVVRLLRRWRCPPESAYLDFGQCILIGVHLVTSTGVPCMQVVGPSCTVPSNEIAVSMLGFLSAKNRL